MYSKICRSFLDPDDLFNSVVILTDYVNGSVEIEIEVVAIAGKIHAGLADRNADLVRQDLNRGYHHEVVDLPTEDKYFRAYHDARIEAMNG